MSFRIDSWLEARECYLDGVKEDEKALFQSATLENLFHIYNTGTVETQHREKSRSNAAAAKLRSLVTAIDYFGSVIDAPSSAASLILRTIWGGIRALLYISSDFRKYYSKLVNILKKLGDIILRFNAYERLFPTHKHIIEYMPLVYLDVFDFCIQASNHFRKVRSSQCTIKEQWKFFMEDSSKPLRRIRLHTERVEVEASLAYIIERVTDKEEHRKEIEQKEWERHLIMLEQQESGGALALQKLSECQPKWKHYKLQRERYTGTGKWITLTSEFHSWISGDNSSCIWLYGIAGSGKTILTTAVIDATKNDYGIDDSLLAYFYCDYENKQTLQPREIIGNIIQQLSSGLHISKIVERVQEIYKNDRVPSMRELSDILLTILEKKPKVFIIIDGLDECMEKERELILPWLVTLERSTKSIVKLFVSSRVEADIRESFTNRNWFFIAASPENTSMDITKVVENTIKKKIRDDKFCVRDPIFLQEVINTLVERGKGRFLWVMFQLDDICREISEDGVRYILKNLPSDLNETYTRALVEITHQGASQVDLAQKAFKWLVAARRALTLDELREAITIKSKDKSIDLYEAPNASQIVRACGKLVVYDHQDRSLHLAHYTVQQFLVSDISSGEIEISQQLASFHFQSQIAEIEAANICVTYLMFNDFETKPEREKALVVTQSDISDLTATGWIPSISRLIKKTKSDMLIFLRKTGPPRPSVCRDQRFNLLLRPRRAVRTKFSLLKYVINHWIEHTIFFEGSQGMIELFAELLLNRKNSFHFRPWGDGEISLSGRIYENLFRWAVKNDYGHIIAILLASSTKTTEHKPSDTSSLIAILDNLAPSYIDCFVEGKSPLYHAAEMCSERTLQVFMSDQSQKLFSRFYTTPTIRTAIMLALSNGHERAAMILLEAFAKNPEFELGYAQNHYHHDKNSYFPLHQAARFGLEKVTKILLCSFGYSHCLAMNYPDTTGFNPIHYCAQNGGLGVMRLLYKTRSLSVSNPGYRTNDYKNSTALYLALFNGHKDVVEFLLGVGALIDEKTYTLAMKATKPGHIQILDAVPPTLETSIRSGYRPKVQNFLSSHKTLFTGKTGRREMLRSLPIRAIVASSKTNNPEVLDELLLWASMDGQVDVMTEMLVGAAEGGAGGLVKRILDMRVALDVNARNSYNERALFLALKNGHEHVVKMLMEAGARNTHKKIHGGEGRNDRFISIARPLV